MAYITIVKGDDTDFLDNQYLVVKFNTDINMAGFKAVFSLDNIELTYPDLSAKYIEIILSNEVTSKLKSGKMYGSLKLIDTEDRIRTVTTVIPFNVITKVMNNSVQVSDQSIQMDVSINKNEFNVDMSIVGLSKTVAESYLSKIQSYDDSLTEIANNVSEMHDEVEVKAVEAASSANLAKQWANSGVLVDGTEYSAKYYADKAETISDNMDAQISDLNETLETIANTSLSNLTDAGKAVIRETAGTGLNMFDLVVKDHILTFEESAGLAPLGTYVYKASDVNRYGYPDFYNKCIEEKAAAVSAQTVLGESTITTYTHTNGHVYYDISDKSAIDTFYAAYGACWMYGIDITNERIFLPRNDYYFKNSDSPGAYVEAGLPNIEGEVYYENSTGVPSQMYGLTRSPEGFQYGGCFTKGTQVGSSRVATTTGTSYSARLDASLSNPIYGNSDTVQPPGVNAVVYMVVGNTTSEVAISNITEVTTTENDTLPLLCHIASDEELNHTSWLLSAGQWNSGSVYSTAYNYLVSEYTEGTQKTDTITAPDGTEYTVSYKVNNGKKIVDVANITQVENLYNAIGSAWYYVLDQSNIQFKLPRSKNMESYTSDVGRLGLDISAGLPNIEGEYFTDAYNSDSNAGVNGAFTSIDDGHIINVHGSTNTYPHLGFDASLSNPVYGNSDTVTPAHTEFYLYFKVANAVQNLQLLNAGEITSALNNISSALADKVNAAGAADASFPSSYHEDLTLGATDSTYTAPADGWFFFHMNTSSGKYCQFVNNTTGFVGFANSTNSYGQAITCPARQGETVTLTYNTDNTLLKFQFIYAQGEVA